MTLKKFMAENPTQSETSTLRTFVSKLISLQKQLDRPYNFDSFLEYRLLTAVDMPAIQLTLRDRLERTDHHAVNRIDY